MTWISFQIKCQASLTYYYYCKRSLSWEVALSERWRKEKAILRRERDQTGSQKNIPRHSPLHPSPLSKRNFRVVFTNQSQVAVLRRVKLLCANGSDWLDLIIYMFIYILFVCLFIWSHFTARGILVPRPGIELTPLALEVQSPNHWSAREVPMYIFNNSSPQVQNKENMIYPSVH